MKKGIIFSLLITLFLFETFSLGVDTEELKKGSKVEFENYEGYTYEILTDEQVRGIGSELSRLITQNNQVFWYRNNKYSVVHAFDEGQLDKIGADIISLEKNVVILHINWIRQILTGFLQERYNYSFEDARLLAIFITYYNAVHRKNMTYFSEIYQTVVLEHIDETNAGLGLSYKEWAGFSRIVIPLTESAERQDLGSLDTSLLTDEDVIEELRKEEDKGLEERKDMVDLKERELEEKKEELAEEKEELEEEKITLQQEEEELEKLKETETEQEIIEQKEEEIEQRKEEIEEKEQEIEQREEDITEKEEEIRRDEDTIRQDEMLLEIEENPERIVEELEKQSTTEPIAENKLYYMKVKEFLTNGHYDNDLFIIDMSTGKVLLKAPDSKICGHEYVVIDEVGVLVITHKGNHSGHYLTLLDLNTLEPIATGEELIFYLSFLRVKNNFIYSIVWDGEKTYYLGKFDLQLNLVAQSEEEIDQYTIFHHYGSRIYINDASKQMIILDADDLSKIGTIDLSGY